MTYKHILLVILFSLTLIACGETTPEIPQITPTPPQPPNPGMATVIGRLVDTQGVFLPQTIVRLAEVVRGIEGRGGAFILDTAHSPAVYTDDAGYFIISNIKAAEYVIVIGDVEITGIYEIIADTDGTARIYNMLADQITNVDLIETTIQLPELSPEDSLTPPSTLEPGVYPPPGTYPTPVPSTPYPIP